MEGTHEKIVGLKGVFTKKGGLDLRRKMSASKFYFF